MPRYTSRRPVPRAYDRATPAPLRLPYLPLTRHYGAYRTAFTAQWVREFLGIELYPWQRNVLDSLANPPPDMAE